MIVKTKILTCNCSFSELTSHTTKEISSALEPEQLDRLIIVNKIDAEGMKLSADDVPPGDDDVPPQTGDDGPAGGDSNDGFIA